MLGFIQVKDFCEKDILINLDNVFAIRNDDDDDLLGENIEIISAAGEIIHVKGGKENWDNLINLMQEAYEEQEEQ